MRPEEKDNTYDYDGKTQVRLIIGKNQNDNNFRYWKVENENVNTPIGGFAIVENLNSYTMIEILGLVVTSKEKAQELSKTHYNNMKRVLKTFNIDELIMMKG